MFEIGQIVPATQSRKLWQDYGPRWHVMVTAPQAELSVSSWLARNGVTEAWYPRREVVTVLKRGHRRTMTRLVPEWPRYMFALCPGAVTSWDDLFERSNRKIVSVVTVNREPAVIDEPSLMRMMDVPNTLKAIRDARAEADRIRSGDRVEIMAGDLAGWYVTVDGIDAGFAGFLLPLLGGARARIEIGSLRKIFG